MRIILTGITISTLMIGAASAQSYESNAARAADSSAGVGGVVVTSNAPPAPTAATSGAKEYGWMTGSLGMDGIVGAMIVRKPAFTQTPKDMEEAIAKAAEVVQTDYCKPGEKFLTGEGLVAFDPGRAEWTVAGRCVTN